MTDQTLKKLLQAVLDHIDAMPSNIERLRAIELAVGSLIDATTDSKEAVCGLVGQALMMVMDSEQRRRGVDLP